PVLLWRYLVFFFRTPVSAPSLIVDLMNKLIRVAPAAPVKFHNNAFNRGIVFEIIETCLLRLARL
ncbi:MAG: hypothetical protein ACSLFL_10575, partial [Alphaproteobacteria bacterium]